MSYALGAAMGLGVLGGTGIILGHGLALAATCIANSDPKPSWHGRRG